MFSFSSEIHGAKLFCDDLGEPLVMPCIFSQSLTHKRIKYSVSYTDDGHRRIKKAHLTPDIISKTTVTEIINELKNFLLWVHEYSADKKHISMAFHHNFPDELLNHYLNEVLICERNKSQPMVKKALSALRAYYNFLAYHGVTNLKILNIERKYMAMAIANTKPRGVVKYFSVGLRAQLYGNARTLRDECILRIGGTCGVRASENKGFLINDFKVGVKKYSGLKSLFREMELNKNQQSFEFFLQGKYSKARRHSGGSSRILYIPRETLERFNKYYETERPSCSIDTFFVTEASSSSVHTLSNGCVTRAFEYARNEILAKQDKGLLPEYLDILDKKHSYHILRHSFGTDTFYDAADEYGMNIDDVTHTSMPYILTARLLGHEVGGRIARETTATYIRSCSIRMGLACYE